MCGFCGVAFTQRSGRIVSRSLLTRMRDTLTHRGPDGAGLFLSERVGLGHRRLSIIDVEGGAQPMASDDGRFQIVYNGEVYNHPALKRDLEASGCRYRTRCDTETVLHLYERHGPRAPEHLRGMFALAIWDEARRELFLTRDRLGVKPLYYVHAEDGSLFFASEIKALVEAGAITPRLNHAAIPEYLANRAPMGTHTMFEGVRRLAPGHSLLWRDGVIEIRQYWDLSFAGAGGPPRSDESWTEEFAERFNESVRLRLMSDVPFGMFLSGGIDSAAITAAMSPLINSPVKTFSVAFAERDANELAYARMVARRYATDHHEVVLTPDEFFDRLPRLIWHEDEPIAHASSIPLHAVSMLAARHVKVVLTGEGSDENLAGYPWYRATVINMALGRRYAGVVPAGMQSGIRRAIDELALPRAFRAKLRRTFLYLPPDLDTILYDNFGVFSRRWQRELLSPALQAEVGGCDPYAAMHAAAARTDAPTMLGSLLYTDIKTYLHELLMKQDQMSMAASIESRVPFLDHPLMEFVASMPDSMKIRGLTTKHVLRQAMRDRLPAPILSRRKMGFPTPLRSWLREAHTGLLDRTILHERAAARNLFQQEVIRRLVGEHRAGTANHTERLWSLVNLELWHRIFVDGEDVASVLPPARAA
jgi:asparagine synthase (glutamine-hydrolysing)